MYLGDYSKNDVDKNGKIIVPKIEKILKLLIDRENGVKVLAASESNAQVFKAFKEKAKKLKEKRSLSKVNEKNCIYYLSDNYDSSSY